MDEVDRKLVVLLQADGRKNYCRSSAKSWADPRPQSPRVSRGLRTRA